MTPANWLTAAFEAAGNLDRVGVLRDRVEALITAQRSMWKDEPGTWTGTPLDREPPLFALVAADSEGSAAGTK